MKFLRAIDTDTRDVMETYRLSQIPFFTEALSRRSQNRYNNK